MKEKLAAALLQLLEYKDGQFRPIIDRAWAKGKKPEEIIARFECDHYPISVMAGGDNHPTNMRWLTVEEHKEFTHGPQRIDRNKVRRRERAAKPKTPAQEKREELTEANKEYRKIVYQQRKSKRKAWLNSLKKGGK